MGLMARVPWVDIFLSLIFLGMVVLGFWQGMLKELYFLLALYMAAILASLYGDFVGGFIQRRLGVGAPEVASAAGFFIVIFLATALLFAIIWSLVGRFRLPASLLALDKIGGVIIGLLTSFVVTSFLAFILQAIIPLSPEGWTFSAVLKEQLPRSVVLNLFVSVRFVVLAMIQPFLPAELPYFLQLQSP